MNPLAKRLAGNAGLGMFSGLITLTTGMARVFLLGLYFEIETFGLFIICFNLVAFLKLLLGIGVAETIYRFHPQFEDQNNDKALSSLTILISYISLGVTLLIFLVASVFSPIIAQSWYDNPELATPILLAALLTGGFLFLQSATAILRAQNQFHLALIFPSLGALMAPIGIYIFHSYGLLSLSNAVIAVGLGEAVGIIGCTAVAIIKSKKRIILTKETLSLQPLRQSKPELRSTLYQTSLLGVLRSSASVGGIFLLGILGHSTQVALLGMATQLYRPINLVQASVASSLGPEVSNLHTRGQFVDLHRLVSLYVRIALFLVVMGWIFAWFFMPMIISAVLGSDYLAAVPVFLILLASGGVVLICQPFLPLAIARGEVGRRNLTECIRFVSLATACAFGLTAMGVALSNIVSNVIGRIVNDLPLFIRMKKSASKLQERRVQRS